jgi:hypothetical protein
LYDCRLPFGASKSCRIFQAITTSIARMMKRENFECLVYIDDFLIIADNILDCQRALDYLLSLIAKLGFEVSWEKVEGPSTSLSFLGVQIDWVTRKLSLPPKKLVAIKELVKLWLTKTKATKRELQQIVGKLNWCMRVVHGGRTFMRNLIDLISKLKKPHHHVRLSKGAINDLLWWAKGLEIFHGITGFNCDDPLPEYEFSTDACLIGGGAHFLNHWFYVNWESDLPEMVNSHINILELEVIHICAELWGSLWRGKHILVRSDNSATVAAINNGTVKNPLMLAIIQQLFWLSVRYDFKLSAAFIPGRLNILSDLISRFHSLDSFYRIPAFLGYNFAEVECREHMTYKTFLLLQDLWMTT